MRVFVEFAWFVAEKVGRKYLWLNLDYEEISLDDVFKKLLPSIVGENLGTALYRLVQERELLVIVNGVIADLTIKLKDGDKILIQPLASGG